MRLRIVSGTLGGRFIRTPRGRATRPTSERVREAWLSSVGPRLPEARVLDLFAGSGALGIEALSRGARHVHFVESDRGAAAILRENLSSLGVADNATVIAKDAFRWLASEPGNWTIALADPPYSGGHAARLVAAYRERPFAECLWVEHADGKDGLEVGASWSRRYGDSRVSRFCSADIV